MTRVSRWYTLAGITAALLLGLATTASAAAGWTVVTPQGLVAGTGNTLAGSFAVTDTDAWVVGSTSTSSGVIPLALHWNGTDWSAVPTPAPSGSYPDWEFTDVAASSATDAWAVGEEYIGRDTNSLYEHWNGTTWSAVAGPNEGKIRAVLDFSPTNAWAFANNLSVVHWNGTAWSVASGAIDSLEVSATGPDDIWGVANDDQVIHYNGTTWTSTTLSVADEGGFVSVAALSSTDVWIAGTTGTAALLEHFNGTSWQQMTLPSSLSATEGVSQVVALSDSDVWAFSVNSTAQPVLANWNGSSWTTYPSPIPGSLVQLTDLTSAAISPSYVWVFGYSTYLTEPMILEYSGA
jgi:hypothetical protein